MTKYVYTYLHLEIGEMGEMDEIVEMVEIGRHFAHFACATSLTEHKYVQFSHWPKWKIELMLMLGWLASWGWARLN